MDEPAATSEPTPPQSPMQRGPGRPRTFACPNCGGPVTLRAAGQSISATCSQCSSLIDVADETLRIIETANKALDAAQIPIGARATLQGIQWEMVGFMRRSDQFGWYPWTEYLLFNPYYGYRFLVEEDGHWTLVRMVNRNVPSAGFVMSIEDEGRNYEFFGQGKTRTNYVAGEFYWRAAVGEATTATDYISPPYRLMAEQNAEEIIVSIGEYIEAEKVAAAFNLELATPPPTSAGVSQVNPHKTWFVIPLVAIIAATLLQIFWVKITPDEIVNSQTYSFTNDDKGKALSSENFMLKRTGNVELETQAKLDNDWLELDVSVISVDTGKTYRASQALEYYNFFDSKAARSETSYLLSSIPAGQYRLLIEPRDGQHSQASRTFTLTVRQGVPTWWNYTIATALLLISGAWGMWKSKAFEADRWEKGGVADENEGWAPGSAGMAAGAGAGAFAAAWWSDDSSSDDDDSSDDDSSDDDDDSGSWDSDDSSSDDSWDSDRSSSDDET